ncbi:beta strand repeat-containing protein [Bythopirellula goksoeyrii]|uniref:Autotransporter-associated beta strand repeat protein n=1 Tax=Bythopirellula goksoeyrii TaxID=1400387 RepID=A0A5B9QI03_9BACT|nr:PEP-CTERM sorting domain-containing protein [Bythopirellula goksoeyrii]QEG37245.1 hypothetical protein Pr1d_45860 [Bythopirellula goksoeyrii]
MTTRHTTNFLFQSMTSAMLWCFTLASLPCASAIDYNWQALFVPPNPNPFYDGNWSSVGNWDHGTFIPSTANDSAIIGLSGVPDYVVTLDLDTHIGTFALDSEDATFDAVSRVFRVDGMSNFNKGIANWDNSQVLDSGAGTLTQSKPATMNVTRTVLIDTANIDLRGTVNVLADDSNTALTVTHGLSNRGLIDISTVSTSSSTLSIPNGTLVNDIVGGMSGELRFSGAGTGQRQFNGSLDNSQFVQVLADTVFGTNGSTVTNTGSFFVAPDTTLTMTAGNQIFNQDAGELVVQGTFNPSSATFNFNGGNVADNANTNPITLTNSSLKIGPSAGSGKFILHNTSSYSGNLKAVQFLTIQGTTASTSVTAATGFTNNSTLTIETTGGGVTQLAITSGTLTNQAAGIINFDGSTSMRRFQGDLDNLGTVNVNGDTDFNRNGDTFTNMNAFNVATDATLLMQIGNQTFNQDAGTLDIQGTFNPSSATFNFNGGDVTGNSMVLTNSTLNIAPTAGSGSFVLRNTSNFSGNLQPGQTVSVQGTASSTSVTAATGFTNNSTLTIETTGGGATQLAITSGTLTNQTAGIINFEGPASIRRFQGDLDNRGTVNVNGDTDFNRNGDTFTNMNAFNVAAGATLTVATGNQIFNQDAGTLDVQGTFNPSSATFNFNGGDVTGNSMVLTNSTLNIAPTAGSGSFVLRNTSNFSGDLQPGQLLTIQGTASSTAVTAATGFTNNSTLTIETTGGGSTQLAITSGTLTNQAAGIINFDGSASILRFQGDLDNLGTVNVNGDTDFNRNGDTFTNMNAFNVAIYATLSMQIGNQTFNQDAGTLNIQGTFNPSSVTFNFNGGDVTGNSMVLTNSTLNIAPTAGSGSFLLRNTSNFSGDLQPGQLLTIQGTASSTAVTAATGFTNNSTLTIETTGGGVTQLAITSGTLTNQAAGIINFDGSASVRRFQGDLDNLGTVNVNGDTDFNRNGDTFTNMNAFNVAAGATLSMQIGNQTFNQDAGTLDIQGTFNPSSATFNFNGGDVTGNSMVLTNSTLNIAPTAGSGSFLLRNTSNFSGDLQPGQLLTIQGTASSTAVTAATGFTNNSTLTIETTGGGSSLLTLSGGVLTNQSGGTLTFGGTGTGIRELRGGLDNRGEIEVDVDARIGATGQTHLNSGEFNLSATAMIVGDSFTNEPGGVIQGNGELNVVATTFLNSGDIAPGDSAGTLTITGDAPFDATGSLSIELNGLAAGSEHDQLIVTGMASLSGTLNLALLGFTPAAGNTFTILTAGTRTGTFDSVNGNPGGGLFYDVQYLADQVVVELVSALPGDFDFDGDIDGYDFIIWQRGDSPNPLSPSDLAAWHASYGTSLVVASTAVPEPSTWIVLLMGTSTLQLRRKIVCPSLNKQTSRRQACLRDSSRTAWRSG